MSETDIYHVMLRGINGQDIFLDDEDRSKLLSVLRKYKPICGFEVYAYCLMDNHIHLLIKRLDEPLGNIVKRIGCSYVQWYNLRHGRRGPLFQDRFRSEPVEDDAYFIAVLRYIHQNPVKAGMTATPESYRWSSYSSYVGWPDGITDINFAIELFPDRARLLAYLNEPGSDQIMDVTHPVRTGMVDEDAIALMESVCGCDNREAFQQLSEAAQRSALRQMRRCGVSFRQLARLTGRSTAFVVKLLRDE